MEPDQADIRAAFRIVNRYMLLAWRLGLSWQMANPVAGYIMVIATTGRRSGERRLVPLNFAHDGDTVWCLAGFGRRTHWLLNLQDNPDCEVWLPRGGRFEGRGELITDEARRVALVRDVLARSGFAAKVAEPGLDPRTAPDAVIADLGPRPGVRYEIVEITLGHPVHGPGGPGDLTWVWPVGAVSVYAVWQLWRRVPGWRRRPTR